MIDRKKVKTAKDKEFRDHIFQITFLKLPIFCEYCCQYIWGTEALRCKACNVLNWVWNGTCDRPDAAAVKEKFRPIALIHGLCHEDCHFDCPGIDHGRITSDHDLTLHEFRERKVETGGICDQCGQFYRHSVYHCSHCSIRLYKQCLNFVPKVCGMASDERRGKTKRITNWYISFPQ